jgi:hypothetical protein
MMMRLLVNDKNEMSMWMPLLGGGTAGVGSWFISYPVDIIKTKL